MRSVGRYLKRIPRATSSTVQSLVLIRYIDATDTLVLRIDEFADAVKRIEVDVDVEIGVDENGRVVEVRVFRASRYGLYSIARNLRRLGIGWLSSSRHR